MAEVFSDQWDDFVKEYSEETYISFSGFDGGGIQLVDGAAGETIRQDNLKNILTEWIDDLDNDPELIEALQELKSSLIACSKIVDKKIHKLSK